LMTFGLYSITTNLLVYNKLGYYHKSFNLINNNLQIYQIILRYWKQ
jgi:hypothetical protein